MPELYTLKLWMMSGVDAEAMMNPDSSEVSNSFDWMH